MASYNDVVKKSKSLADVISRSVAKGAPRKTGNLQRALKRANNINTMFEVQGGTSKEISVRSLVFTYNYAPDDAEYGMWWNDPTVSKTVRNGKTKNVPESINFAEKAMYSPIVDSLINDYMDEIGVMVIEEISKAIDDLK
jgi:hypothetical protein